jgi:6-phospho-beta-glucosidase
MGIKITVIGGASSYTPELFANLIEFRERLDVDQVTLMDLNSEKLAFIADVCERVLGGAHTGIKLVTTQHHEEAIAGADFIILQIRVGGLAARVRDERLPMEFDMVGNETTGAGGFVCGLRTVPVAMEIARYVERLAPEAWLLNLSNPAGIVTEAFLKHSQVRAVGFCNIPINTTYGLAEVLGVEPSQIRLDSFGLNHLSWTRGVYIGDEEMLQPLIVATHSRNSSLYQHGLVDSLIDPEWLRALGMIPGWYLRYFYYPKQILDKDRQSSRSRGEADMLAEERLREIYSTAGYGQEARRVLEAKGGARYYLSVLKVVDSIVHDSGKVAVVDVRNGNALPDLPPEVCVEVPARIGRDHVDPLPMGRMPLSVRGLVQAVKTYEELTVEAALTGDQGTAMAALMVNPLVGSYPKARAFLERVLENERPYLPPFFD